MPNLLSSVVLLREKDPEAIRGMPIGSTETYDASGLRHHPLLEKIRGLCGRGQRRRVDLEQNQAGIEGLKDNVLQVGDAPTPALADFLQAEGAARRRAHQVPPVRRYCCSSGRISLVSEQMADSKSHYLERSKIGQDVFLRHSSPMLLDAKLPKRRAVE